MHNLKSLINKARERYDDMAAGVSNWFTDRREFFAALFNILSIAAFTLGVLALLALIWLYVRPIPTANIKVPVATDQASYYPGEPVSGIFFGDTYYTGEVRILREVFCKDYKGVIKPPAESAVGNFFSTQARPRHLEGQSVAVGNLPADVPVGANCVLQFTNIYTIQTPFGIRHEEYQYYTQNFAIITKERRLQLDCEASGRKDCNFINDIPASEGDTTATAPVEQSSPESAPEPVIVQPQTNNVQEGDTYNDNSTVVNNPPAEQEPAPKYVERCTINVLGIKAICRNVLAE